MVEVTSFRGCSGNRLAADVYRGAAGGRTVVLAHGGGQTRHSWQRVAQRLADIGWTAINFDQRGHGESAWIDSGQYDFDGFAGDLVAVSDAVTEQFGHRPVVIGASLGGMAAMLAEGESDRRVLSGIVLVDITPRVRQSGVDRIVTFMAARSDEGFASLAEAADAISAYLPHRERPSDLSGLAKNLRLGPDGRYRWHWDPQFIADPPTAANREAIEHRLVGAAKALETPVLLVRGRDSELVDEAVAQEFLQLVPHADYVDVAEARHMVAGDENDAFGDAVVGFLRSLP